MCVCVCVSRIEIEMLIGHFVNALLDCSQPMRATTKKNTLIHSLTFTLSQNYSSWATILALENEDICHRRRLPDVYAVC